MGISDLERISSGWSCLEGSSQEIRQDPWTDRCDFQRSRPGDSKWRRQARRWRSDLCVVTKDKDGGVQGHCSPRGGIGGPGVHRWSHSAWSGGRTQARRGREIDHSGREGPQHCGESIRDPREDPGVTRQYRRSRFCGGEQDRRCGLLSVP